MVQRSAEMQARTRRLWASLTESPRAASHAVAGRAALVLVAAVLCVGYGLERVWHFTIDDAGISYAYAQHIANGQGLVAVEGGPRIEGYSNFLWVLLLVPLSWLGVMLTGAKVLATMACAAAIVLGMTLASKLDSRRGFQLSWSDAAVPIILGLAPQFVVWVPAGLENALHAALVLSMLGCDAAEAEHPTRRPWSGIPALLLCLTRPEGVLYAAALGAVKLVHCVARRDYLRQVFLYALVLLIGLSAFYSWRFVTFGDWVPNTYYAKPHVDDSTGAAVAYLAKHAGTNNVLLYTIPLAVLGVWRHLRIKLAILSSVLCALGFIFYAGGDWMPEGRFLSLGLAPFAVLVACGVANLERLLIFPGRGRSFAIRLARQKWVSFGLVALFGALWFNQQQRPLNAIARQAWCHLCERISDVNRLTRLQSKLGVRSATLVTHDFGGPAWLSNDRLYPLDMLGLCDHAMGRAWAERGEGRFREFDWTRFQYLFHEQGRFPTFVYFPGHFWKDFEASPEFRFGYYELPAQSLGPKRRRDAVFGVHRGAFIDYFPEIGEFVFRELTPSLTLLGFGIEGLAKPGNTLTVRIALVRGETSAPEASSDISGLDLRFKQSPAPPQPQTLFPRALALGKRWDAGEPRELEWETAVPDGGTRGLELELGVEREGGWHWIDLAQVEPNREFRVQDEVGDFPSNLPLPEDELTRLASRAREVISARFGEAGQGLGDPGLGAELAQYARSASTAGKPDQAYLARVLATQADRSLLRSEHRLIEAQRPVWSNHSYVRELSLLQHAYEGGESNRIVFLAADYARRGAWVSAKYFATRVTPTGDLVADHGQLLAAIDRRDSNQVPKGFVEQPIPGVESLFETDNLRGWTTHGVFRGTPYRVPQEQKPALRGFQGTHVLTTLGGTGRSGTAESAEFIVNASHLGVMLAGTPQAGSVELHVDGKSVAALRPEGSPYFSYQFFDLRPHRGKSGKVVVTARSVSASSYLAVDAFGLWP